MEHKHFVSFELSILSFPCYETKLLYHFTSKEELSILRIDVSAIDDSDTSRKIIQWKTKAPFTDEKTALKEFLTDMFSYSGSCMGYPSFIESELISGLEFDQIRDKGIENIHERQRQTEEMGKNNPLILFCTEHKLHPQPLDHSPHSWQANCPSGGRHHIMISTSTNTWGCGYCRKKGDLKDLHIWLQEKKIGNN